MKKIGILSSSIRKDRKSHRVVLFFKNYLEENSLADAFIIDLKAYNFPVFEERKNYTENPSRQVLEFTNEFTSCDGVIIVTPEYNGSIPASLKNVIDLMNAEWYRKPIAISTVSSGSFGGTQAIMHLEFMLWKLKAWMVPAYFPVPEVDKNFDESGNAMDAVKTNKRAGIFISELLWSIEAKSKMESQ